MQASAEIFRWQAMIGLLLLVQLTGCTSYQLDGVVVKSDRASVNALAWDENPDTLPGPPMTGVRVEVIFEPRTTRPQKLSIVSSDDQGRFTIPINQTGVGLMEYEIMVVARLAGYRTSWRIVRIPDRNQTMVIEMVPGRDDEGLPMDLLEESMNMRRMLEGF